MERAVQIKKICILGMLLMCLMVLLPGEKALAAKLNTTSAEILTGGEWVKDGKVIRYIKSTGEYALNGFKQIDGNWYFFNRKGKLITGLKKLKGKYYYFAPTGRPGKIGIMQTGLVSINGQDYFFRAKGRTGVLGSRIESAWKAVDGKKYYFRADGSKGTEYLEDSKFIKTVGKLARADMKKTGILASVTVAQAILESGYGRSELALEANNLFGMKAELSGNTWKSSWDGRTYEKKTLEYIGGRYITIKASFRAYPNIAASLLDHSHYLSRAMNGSSLRYKGVVRNKSYLKTIQIIKNGGYATAPDYVSAIVNIIKKYRLTRYDK